MPPTIELLEETSTTSTLRMPKGLADYIISIKMGNSNFDIDLRELSSDEVTPELIAKAEASRKKDRSEFINI